MSLKQQFPFLFDFIEAKEHFDDINFRFPGKKFPFLFDFIEAKVSLKDNQLSLKEIYLFPFLFDFIEAKAR